MNKGVHRYTSTSKQGRSMISPGRNHYAHRIPTEIQEWNAKVEAAKKAKLEAKLVKKGLVRSLANGASE